MTWEIFRFEIGYQARRASTGLYFFALMTIAFLAAGEPAQEFAQMDESFVNGPFLVAVGTLFAGTLALLVIAATAGEAAARDTETRMAPLVHTAPITTREYLSGRFLGAFGMSALLLLAVPLGLLLAGLAAGGESDLVGPRRISTYLLPYFCLLLPNAFVANAVMFSIAALNRRPVMGFVGGILLLACCVLGWTTARTSGHWNLGKLIDPFGAVFLDEISMVWTPSERSTQAVGLQGALLWNRLTWVAIALGVLALTWSKFRFSHGGKSATRAAEVHIQDDAVPAAATAELPRIHREFGIATHLRQMLLISVEAFRAIVIGWGGFMLAGAAAFLAYSGIPLAHLGVPIVPTTERMLGFLAAPLTRLDEINSIVIPLLIIFFAGELVWREREARVSDIADAAPAPDWTLFLGKFGGLGLALAVLQALVMAAGVFLQLRWSHADLQPGLYFRVLFGIQFVDLLLFGLLSLFIHVAVNHKYVGHLVALIAYMFVAFAPALGIQHNLLIFASDPGWTYSDMRGYGPFIVPWLWFKLYWTAWAGVLSIAATLVSSRGRGTDLRSRLRLSRRRLSGWTAGAAALCFASVLLVGGFVYYNTNILGSYRSPAEISARRADYERIYGRYRDLNHPRLTKATLDVQLYPLERRAEIHGAYYLLNTTSAPIEAVHLATKPGVETSGIRLDRLAGEIRQDNDLGHRIFALEKPLQPGESLRLDFKVRFNPRGFHNRNLDVSVVANGSFIRNDAWLPAIGYQADRELRGRFVRAAHGLPPKPEIRPLEDETARQDLTRWGGIMLETVVSTDTGQLALAPGRLVRKWQENGRSYFRYETDVPIRNDFSILSARYNIREARWNEVAIEVWHHADHARNADRMIRAVQAALDEYTKQFGAYQHGQIRLVERPGGSVLLHASPINIDFEETFALLDPEGDPRGIDLPFAVVAHEVAHQWWGNTLVPAEVEGASVLTEALAWYSAMGVVENALGRDHLERLLAMMREAYLTPRSLANVPLLRATDQFLAYRKGPFAMYAMREYIGVERVNGALRRLLETYGTGAAPLPTSLDLYRELRAVTPVEFLPLLADLFETNTYWELSAQQVMTERVETGGWRVTLDVRARKFAIDASGVETEVAMDDLVEIGVFSPGKNAELSKPLYLRRHRIHSGSQRITVTAVGRPGSAGIDPRRLLIELNGTDNLKLIP